MKETKKKKGAHKELLQRQQDRLDGKLNPPVRGVRGLGGWRGLGALLRIKWGGRDHPPDWEHGRPPRKLL